MDVTTAGLGPLVSAFAAASGALSLPSGTLTDLIGGRRTLVGVFLCSMLSLMALSAAPSYGWLVAAMVLAGFANSAANPSTNRVIAANMEPRHIGMAAGVKMAGVQLAVLASGALLPLIAATLGWRLPVGVGAVVVCGVGILGVAVLIGREAPRDRHAARPRLEFSRELRLLTLYGLFMSAGGSASLTYLSLYAVDALGSTARVGGFAIAAFGAVAIPGRLGLGRLTQASSRPMRTLSAVGVLAFGSTLLVLVSTDAGTVPFWLGVAGLGLSAQSFVAGSTVALIGRLPAEKIGGSSGIMFMGLLIGYGGGPAGFGAIAESRAGYSTAWLMVALLFLCGAAVAWWSSVGDHPT
jgi:predicted MFS family arabinose efflux permease